MTEGENEAAVRFVRPRGFIGPCMKKTCPGWLRKIRCDRILGHESQRTPLPWLIIQPYSSDGAVPAGDLGQGNLAIRKGDPSAHGTARRLLSKHCLKEKVRG
jgi:hypothetical protein